VTTVNLRRRAAGWWKCDDTGIEIQRQQLWDGPWWIVYGPPDEITGRPQWRSEPYRRLAEARRIAENSTLAEATETMEAS
jgi:hypothetical protein